jgi:predicted metal-dependent phosphoesterase TrpH
MSPENSSYYDLHIHGRRSTDSWTPYRKIFKKAQERGLRGLAITDHDTTKAYAKACELADKTGLQLFGASSEVTTTLGVNRYPHILALNMPHKELKKYLRQFHPLSGHFPPTEEFLSWAQQFPSGLVVVAHPVPDEGPWLRKINSLTYSEIERYHEFIDGMEVISKLPGAYDESRREVAERLGLAMTGSSDAHRARFVGTVATEIPGHPETIEEVVLMIKQRQSQPHVYEAIQTEQSLIGVS